MVMHGNNMPRTANQHANRTVFQADMREEGRRKEEEIRRQQETERLRHKEEEGRCAALGHVVRDSERRVALALARQEGLNDSDGASQVARAVLISSKHQLERQALCLS